jgi:hypothetical protein
MAVISIKNKTKSGSLLNGNAPFIPNDYESIATVTASGSSATLSFTSIPSTYQHLQIRGIVKSTTSGSSLTGVNLTFNSDGSSSYSRHILYGNGSSATVYGNTSNAAWSIGADDVPTAGYTNIFGAHIIDILDYTNTNKNKTVRALTGADVNGAGVVALSSTVFIKTAAISSIELNCASGNFASGTTYALYGIKG